MPVNRAFGILVLFTFFFNPCSAQIFEWVDTYETDGYFSWLSDIVVDTQGNVYVSGIFHGTTKIQGKTISNLSNDADSYIAKYNASGVLLWIKHLSSSRLLYVQDMTLAKNGNLLATGTYQRSLSIDGFSMSLAANSGDFGNTFIFEFNSAGTVVAASDVGVQQANMADDAYAMTTDNMGNIYLAGTSGTRMLFRKLSSDRKLIWSKTYGYSSNVGYAIAGTMTIDDNGNIYSSGRLGNECVLMKFDNSGTLIWEQKEINLVNSISVINTNELVICGTVKSGDVVGGERIDTDGGLIAKLDANGKMIWKHVIAGYKAAQLVVDDHNDIYITGNITAAAQFKPFDLTLEGASNIVLASISNNGYFKWVSKVGEKYDGDFGDVIETDNNGNIYIGNQIKRDSLAKFQCVEQKGKSRLDKFVAKIVPFKTVPIVGPTQLCVSAEAEVKFTPISDYITYKWDFAGDNFQTSFVNDTTVRLKSATPGTIVASVITAVDLNCEIFKVNHSFPILVKSPPEDEVISGKKSVCSGEQNVEYTIDPSDEVVEWILPQEVLYVNHEKSTLIINFSKEFVQGDISFKKSNFCGTVVSTPLQVKAIPGVERAKNITGPNETCIGTNAVKYITSELPHADYYIWTLSSNMYSSVGDIVTPKPEISVDFSGTPGEGRISVEGWNKCSRGGESSDYVIVIKSRPDEPGQIVGPTNICQGTSGIYRIENVNNAESYFWRYKDASGGVIKTVKTNANNFEVAVTSNGIIQVSASNKCGVSSLINYSVEVIERDNDIPVIKKECNTLSHPEDTRNLQWYKEGILINGAPTLFVDKAGIYELRFTGLCDSHSDFISIKSDEISGFVPNVITPNDDGKNESWELSPYLAGSSIAIYDRWGMSVFTANNYQNDWNARGLPTGTYFYTIQTVCGNNVLKGWITIVR